MMTVVVVVFFIGGGDFGVLSRLIHRTYIACFTILCSVDWLLIYCIYSSIVISSIWYQCTSPTGCLTIVRGPDSRHFNPLPIRLSAFLQRELLENRSAEPQ